MNKMLRQLSPLGMMSLFFLFTLTACDPERKNKCEWYLVPEPEHRHMVEPGWVSLCARNFTTKKQKCLLKAPLKFAEDVYGKTFRYKSLKFEKSPIPRKIISMELCQPEDKATP